MKIYEKVPYFAFAVIIALSACASIGDRQSKQLIEIVKASKNANAEVETQLRDNKILFISEQHTIVNPILFLTKNIKSFYDAGVRYLFLEGGFPALSSSQDYRFPIFYPWSKVGWKYEEVELALAIDGINNTVPEHEELRVIFAEEGNVEPSSYDPGNAPTYINARDLYAYNRILQIMDNSKPEDKAIIFYGGGHGAKEIIKNENRGGGVPVFDWKPLGAHLKEHYHEQYTALGYGYIEQYWIRGTATAPDLRVETPKYINYKTLARSLRYYPDNLYDAVILEQSPLYGLGYQFVPTDANLRAIFTALRENDRLLDNGIPTAQNMRFSPLGSYLIEIYYLKLYYGEHFEYSLWNPQEKLSKALDKLEEYAFAPGDSPSRHIEVYFPEKKALYEYSKLMNESGIDQYINYEKTRSRNNERIIVAMEKASELFPGDVWPLYWLALAHRANKDYARALTECELILGNPLGRCMEVLPKVYEMASECALETGKTKESAHYDRSRMELRTERNIMMMEFPDIL